LELNYNNDANYKNHRNLSWIFKIISGFIGILEYWNTGILGNPASRGIPLLFF